MTPQPPPPDTGPLSSLTDKALAWGLPRRQKVVLVMDLVESVRLMAANEAAVVQRWHAFVQHARAQVLPACHGRHVKSLGDGLLAEFDSASEAVQAAQDLHAYFDHVNTRLPQDQRLYLRAGLNAAQIYVDSIDIYGNGVNLAARVAALAGPGETTITTEVRDLLTDGLDGEIHDLGECYLKHVTEPVRVWRVGHAGPNPVLIPSSEQVAAHIPTIAVIPFSALGNEPEHQVVGELIADAVISLLGRTSHLRAISRLSTRVFRDRAADAAEVGARLGAQFVLSGSYAVVGSQGGGKLLVTAELAHATSRQVAWAERFTAEIGDLLLSESECAHHIALSCSTAILNRETEKARTQPVASLTGYSLQMSAINLMHRSQVADFERGHALLLALVERYPRAPEVRAWLAKWHVLRVMRGISPSPQDDARRALDACRRALDAAPGHPLALATEGHVRCQLLGDGAHAQQLLDACTEQSPNELHGWLYRSVWSTMYGSASDAVLEAEQACTLSPVDPHASYLMTILASACITDRQYERGIRTARAALRLDRFHTPTLRALLVALVETDELEAARQVHHDLLRLQPDFSLQRYLSMGSADSSTRQRMVDALRRIDA